MRNEGIILVTGVTGFVGRQVLDRLISLGKRIRIIVRKDKQHQFDGRPEIEKVIPTTDLFSESVEWWEKVCQNVDTLIHVAWYTEHGKYLQSSKNIDCLVCTLMMGKGAAKAEVRRVIGIGTCFEYDLSNDVLSVETPLDPLTPYAGSKAAAYLALSQILPVLNVEFAWCRLFYLYGEGEDNRRLVPYIRSRLIKGLPVNLTSGNQIRDFMDVKDAGQLIVKVGYSKLLGAVNICSGIPITVRKLAESIADEYGRRDLLRFGQRKENYFDPHKVVGLCNLK